MKPIPRHTHSIEIEFSDKYNLLFRATFPLKNINKQNISDWYKRVKKTVATSHDLPVWQVRGKHKIIESKIFDRILFEWVGGISIDLPDDVTSYDYKIIIHYLEGLKMAL